MKQQESRLNGHMEIVTIRPTLDFMVLRREPKQTSLIIPNEKDTSADIYEVLDVGPGYYQNDTFIKPPVGKGDKVMIVGNLFEFKYKDRKFLLARANSVISVVA